MSNSDSALEVFEYWKMVMNKKGRCMFSAKRAGKIKARLKDGYTIDEIKDAIDGCSKSSFHMGANSGGKKYNDIELICRDEAKLEGFIEANEPQEVINETRKLSHSARTLGTSERLQAFFEANEDCCETVGGDVSYLPGTVDGSRGGSGERGATNGGVYSVVQENGGPNR